MLVTGASSGIGRELARLLAPRAKALVLVARRLERLEELRAELLQAHPSLEVHVERCDLSVPGEEKTMLERVLGKTGRIDVLVNNAGIVDDAMFRKMSDEQFERVIDINLKGTYNCARAVVDIMIAQNAGVILNASSVVGLYGNFGQTNYAASKFGVIGMAKTWARELGRKGIRANAVCPGFVETTILKSIPQKVMQSMIDRVPLGRLAKPEEIANTYAFLASDEASYINGAVIEVSGGATI